MNFIDKFIKKCEEYGDYVAIIDNNGDRKTTYGELSILSKKIAKKLIDLGIKKNDNVVIALPKSREYIASIYGIIFAGACYVPLSDDYPQDRKQQIINETESKIVIDNNFFNDIDMFDMIKNICINKEQNTCILYTSGTTGKPKGVLFDFEMGDINFKTLVNVAKNFEHRTQLYISPFYFIAHGWSIAQLLFNEQTTLHLLSDEKARDLNFLLDYLNRYEIDFMFTLPSMEKYLENAEKLKTVILGGEKVVDVYSDKMRIVTIYAQTEGFIVFSHEINKKTKEAIIGKPAMNTDFKILDDNNNEVKKGEIGEICGISKFATCYYKDEKLTKMTFEKLQNGDTLYHTKDLGYINEDGDVVYVSRKDDMLKISGKRVEPSEIENVIKSIENIDKCVVKMVCANNVELLCAFYTTKNGNMVSSNKIIENIYDKLPLYMMPDRFIYKDNFPIGRTGKIEKHLLTIDDAIDSDKKVEKGKTELENAIIKAFKDVLGLEVGRNDDFFLLGGDSIQAASVSSILSDYGVGVIDIYKYRTPQSIAKCYEKYDKDELDKKYVLSLKSDQPLQDELKKYFVSCHENCPTLFNFSMLPFVVEMQKNKLNLEKLSKSAYEVFKTHPSVCSIYVKDDIETYRLRYKPEALEKVEVLDKKESEIIDYLMQLMIVKKAIDAPIFKCKIVRTEKADYFIMVHSHVLTDVYSYTLLFKQIIEHYMTDKLPDKDYYYLYIKKIHDMDMIDENNKIISEYIKNIDDDSYSGIFRYDTDIKVDKKENMRFICDIGQTQFAMKLYAKNMRVSLSSLYMGALLKTIAEYNGVKKVKSSYSYNNRDTNLKNNMVGCLANPMMSFADFEKIKSDNEMLKIIEEQSINYYSVNDSTCKCHPVQSKVFFDYLNNSNDLKDMQLAIFNYRYDIFGQINYSQIPADICFFVAEPTDEKNNVQVFILASNEYYKKESIDKISKMFVKNLYDILQI